MEAWLKVALGKGDSPRETRDSPKNEIIVVKHVP